MASLCFPMRWAEYQQRGDKETLAKKRTLFFRATFMPFLASAIMRVRNGDHKALCAFANRLESGLTRRLISHPVQADILIQIIIFAKSG